MDTFEAQRRLREILSRLNASTKSVEAAVQFLLKNRDQLPDLYQFTLDSLGNKQTSLRARANTAFLLEHLCGPAGRHIPEIKKWVKRDIDTVILSVVPRAIPALVNAPPMEQILNNLHRLGVYDSETLAQAKNTLNLRIKEARESGVDDAPVSLTNQEILRRMEEDRERTKKVKERLWTVDLASSKEFDFLWETLGGLNTLDREQIAEDNELAKESRRW